MIPSIHRAIAALTNAEFVVSTSGGRYTVAYGVEVLFRQGDAHEFLIFADGVAAGLSGCARRSQRASLERALENSPHHQAALKHPEFKSEIANRKSQMGKGVTK